MAERTRKTESRSGDRRANRTILGRTIFLMVIFGVVVFIPLFWKLWDVQISQHDKLEEQAIDQQTRDLLLYNRRRLAEKEVQAEKQAGLVMGS